MHDGETYRVVVTGANSGLGFAICCRLIDEFLQTRPSSHSVHLYFTTRDDRKRSQTLRDINAHIGNTLKEVDNGRARDRLAGPRVTIQGLLCDLTILSTVKKMVTSVVRELEQVDGTIDAVVCNAGIGGWTGLHWGQAIRDLLFDFMQATTFPTYQSCKVGALARRQVPESPDKSAEPVLGEVFAANVFGHYMLVSWAATRFTAKSRVIWMSSLSAQPQYLDLNDFQCIGNTEAYESSKRLTDLLVLTSEDPKNKTLVQSFLQTQNRGLGDANDAAHETPRMYLTQPGVVFTGINGLPWYLSVFILGAFWLARWLGSPWHCIKPYTGAVSAVWTCLASDEVLRDSELRFGKGKWGSVVNVYGDEGVKRTEVDGWGFNGVVGPAPSGSVSGKHGRLRGMKKFTAEQREAFEQQGNVAWSQMQSLAKTWNMELLKRTPTSEANEALVPDDRNVSIP